MIHRRCRRRSTLPSALALVLGLAIALGAAGPAVGQGALRSANFAQPRAAIGNRAWLVPIGGTFRLTGVPLGARKAAMVLERFEVFTPDARVLVHGEGAPVLAPAPARVYFRGRVDEDPASLAFVSVGKGGDLRGLIASRETTYLVGVDLPDGVDAATAPEAPLVVRAADERAIAAAQRGWRCEAGGFTPPISRGFESAHAPATPEIEGNATQAQHSIKVSIETDAEFYALFNNVDRAAGYIGDLLGAISTIYNRDINTTLRVNLISLWTAGAANDPWTANSSTLSALCELGGYWAANRPQATYPRAITHMLSGKGLGGGIAWVGVLCSGDFSSGSCPTGLGGGYGFTANISGAFNPNSSTVVWDIESVAHEIGHNFNSPHTHCYNNIPTSGSPPIDQCYGSQSGCYAGATSLPAGGRGSIMSYCHLLGSIANNIALSFGSAGLYGTQSERVPARMKTYVQGLAASCRGIVNSPPGDFNGDGRSEPYVYRDGAWLTFPVWPEK